MGAAIAQSPVTGDRMLAVVAGGSVALSVAAVLARFAGVLPDGPAANVNPVPSPSNKHPGDGGATADA
jgi:hypothetical protein